MDTVWMPQGKCVCDGKEITVVLKLQLYSMHESVCGVSNHCMSEFDFLAIPFL